MPISVICIQCSKRLSVPESRVGRPCPCPACGFEFQVDHGPGGAWVITPVSPPAPTSTALAVIPPPPPPPPPPPVIKITIPLPPPPPPVIRTRVQDPPFFVDDGAVIECPWCQRRRRVHEDLFNEELECSGCRKEYIVRVRDDRKIEFKCPNCHEPMLIAGHMAGEVVQCAQPACGLANVLVPDSPIRVRKVKGDERPRPSTRSASPPPPSGPRACSVCGLRFPRNPTGICHKCRSWLKI